MKVAGGRIWVGAYALTATLPRFSDEDARAFYEALAAMPEIAGLELPIHLLEKADDPWRHLQHLPRHFDYILTPLPAVMQSLEQQAAFGLASPVAAGRAAALQLAAEWRERVRRLEDHCGRAAVRALVLHSAPTARASASAFRQSLSELQQKDWGETELWIEHCDAFRAEQKAAKGFLDIEAEIGIAQDLQVGMTINWGRSVLETRRVAGGAEHMQKAADAGVFKGLFLSSVAADDPVYGSWLDNHAPIQWAAEASWMPQRSLLKLENLEPLLGALPKGTLLGLKIQPAPATLPLAERLDCLRQHLALLGSFSCGRGSP